ncbi:Branched-chain amino acid transport ATP-binding protein LivF (TC 3.A.1.4.1) [hydrothermal vent metagenome]|uniref:Branched-chain amino acid transport ATP-binding protein LivF (TC 3.A.1.4.1) n=1 Tax=hydrothermal vent metagenome TaxID=652676 RepID=A0A3B0U2C8_9ZZZZ
MLEVANLTAGYGDIIAVRDFSFAINEGEILAVLGPNGAGKSTTLMALAGLVDCQSGTIIVKGTDISQLPAQRRIRHGLTIVPEGRRVFPDLSVKENLIVGGYTMARGQADEGISKVFGYFPRLGERSRQLAGSLSGGEQQMLAIGRALVSQPKLLLVDELSLGLMPKVIDECYAVLEVLKAQGLSILLVDQHAERALEVANTICVLEAGNPTWQGSAADARADKKLVGALLGYD